MRINPRYGAAPIIVIDGDASDQLTPLVRQRRRFAAMLDGLDRAAWSAPSRCDGWTVQDVVAHLVGVNTFWRASITSGLTGKPTRYLETFDPAATPMQMVDGMRDLSRDEVLEQFLTSNEALLATVESLDRAGWEKTAESPAGHVSIRLVGMHALWDCWVHERDVALPLGVVPPVVDDEALSCLRYAAAISPALALSTGTAPTGTYGISAQDPGESLTLEIGERVTVSDRVAPAGVPRLRGRTVDLVEALSIRGPLPDSTPAEWSRLLGGLAEAFDQPV